MAKFLIRSACAVMASLALAMLCACGQGESNVAAGNREGVLHFGNGTEPQSLDPHVMSGSPEVHIARALFEGLVTRNPHTLQLDPGVAERWELSGDGKTMTFFLNPGARWSNGDPVTAEDFVWSLRRSLHPAMGNQLAYTLFPIVGAQAFSEGKSKDPRTVGIQAIDPLTLRITLTNPNPFFLATLATYPTYPVHRATIEAHGNSHDRFTPWTRVENFVGNGPFNLAEWKLNRRLVVTKSETYWDADNVALNAVVFHPIENQVSEEKMFRMGQLHHTNEVPLSKIPRYRNLPDSPYQQAPMQGTYFLQLNTQRSPLDNPHVRKALALAIDREKLVGAVLEGAELANSSLVPSGTPDYTSPDLLGYDPERARKLLAAAGYPGGKDWPGLDFLFNTSEYHRTIAVALQQMWKDQLNIQVSLHNQEWKVFLDTVQEKNYDMSRMGWLAADLDPLTFLRIQTTNSGINRTGYSNERYDELVLRLVPETADPEQRLALMQEAETLVLRDVPLIPLYTYNSRHLVQPGVHGVPANVLDIQNFKYISLNPAVPAWNAER